MGREETMLGCYEPGGFFHPHRDGDSSPGGGKFEDGRILTLIYYLNPDHPKFGGELRLWPSGRNHVAIQPEADTLVLFRADELLHEVCKCSATRWALTIWFHGKAMKPERH